MSQHSNESIHSPQLPFQVRIKPQHTYINERMEINDTPEKISFSSDQPINNSTPSPDLKPISSRDQQIYNPVPITSPSNSTPSAKLHFKNTSFFAIFLIIFNYIFTDIEKKPRSFKIGLFTIFIVVGFLVLMQSALQLSPLVFLKIAETQVGDTDIILTPTSATNDSRLQDPEFNSNPLNSIRLLDGEYLEDLCDKMSELVGCSPRWVLFGDAANDSGEKIRVFVLAFDSKKEISIGLGRNLMAPEIKGNESYLTLSTVISLNLNTKVNLKMDILNSLIYQGYVTLNDSENSNKSKEEQVADLKNILKDSLRGFFVTLGANTGQVNTTINSSVIKENSRNISNLIKDSGLPLNDSINNYPNLRNNIEQTLNLPSNILSNNSLQLNDVVALLDSVETLPNDTSININSTLEAFLDVIIDSLNLTSSFEIKSNISSPNGKWPDALGNVLAFDYHYIPNIIINSIYEALEKSPDPVLQSLLPTPAFRNTLTQTISSINLKQFTLTENLVLKDRMNIYMDQNTIDRTFIDTTNKFFKLIGKDYPATASIPLALSVQGVLIIKSFLDSVFTSAVFILILLSMLLIYSLMISNIDEKTYEFGMLRALGFKSSSLIILLLVQGLIYAIPAMAFGFLFSFVANGMVGFMLFDWAAEISDYSLHYSAIIIGFLLGILMPIFSNIIPIIRALSKTLRDSLDLYHRVINIMAVRIMKLEKLGISFSQLINSLSLIIIGITTYYFAPLAFVRSDVALFLAIMNIVLIFLILGFTIFISLFQKMFEQFLLYTCLCGSDRKLRPLIQKNMKAHDNRNSKTALMFTICIAFLIFSGTGFNLQINVIENNLRLLIGSDIGVEDASFGLDEANMRIFLESYIKKHPNNIAGYSFSSVPLDAMPGVYLPQFSPLSGFPSKDCKIMGVESNYLQTSYTKFYLPTEYDISINYPLLPDEKKDGFWGLFTQDGSDPLSLNQDPELLLSNSQIRPENISSGLTETLMLIVPEGARAGLAIDTNTPGKISFGNRTYKTKIRNMARKVPGLGFKFSSYQTVVSSLWVVVSMDQMRNLMESEWRFNDEASDKTEIEEFYNNKPKNMSYGILKQKLLIKFNRPLSWDERTELANGLRNYFLSDFTFLFDTQNLVEASEGAFFFINLFYLIVAFISIVLSFFLILVSFMSNVKENSWEFGVLRAIGLNKYQMTRMYMYEAGVLTASSGILGTIVGIVVAVTLIMQFLLFTELPFEFLFPTNIFCITFFLGLGTALGGSYYAVLEVREKTIANITKGLL